MKSTPFFLARLTLVQHLALYEAFHRDPANRAIHHVALPMVVLSGLIPCAYTGLGPWFVLATVVVFATVDALGAALVGMAGVLLVALAGVMVELLPGWIPLACALGLHAFGWYVAVVVGHEQLEARVSMAGRIEDSNAYFRRRYYLAADLGLPVTLTDRAVAVGVAALSSVHALLVTLGFRQQLEADVLAERERVLANLAGSGKPFVEEWVPAGHPG